MPKTMDVDIYDRTNRIGEAFANLSMSKQPARRFQFAVKRHKQFKLNETGQDHFYVVSIRKKSSGIEQLKKLREQLDHKRLKGFVAVLSKKLASDLELQKILLQQGRTNAIRFIIDDPEDANPERIIQRYLIDLAEAVDADKTKNAPTGKAFHPAYLMASQPIRNPKSHRLDAKRIATYFNLSLRELARILGKSHATVDKTPDSKNLQAQLQPYEAILRGRILVENDDTLFQQWLNTACDEFPENDGKAPTPMDIIRMGHPEVVAGLVDEALTGQPA